MSRTPRHRSTPLMRAALAIATLLVAALTAPEQRASAEAGSWSPSGPDGGWASRVAYDPWSPSTLYVGMVGGVYRSDDAGSSWRRLATSGLPYNVGAITVDLRAPSTLYAVTDQGPYRSTNRGASWSPANAGLRDWTSPIQIDVRTNRLYATDGWTIYRSDNAGASWRATLTAPGGYYYALELSPHSPPTLYAGTGQGLFRTEDGGDSWSPINAVAGQGGVYAVAFHPWERGTIYVNLNTTAIYRSDDGGLSWRPAGPGLAFDYLSNLLIDPRDPDRMFVTANFTDPNASPRAARLYRSDDGGASWRAASDGLYASYAFALTLVPSSPPALMVSTSRGVYRSEDGLSWRPGSAGVRATRVTGVARHPGNPARVVIATDDGVYRSDDGGASWQPSDDGLPRIEIEQLVAGPPASPVLYVLANSLLASSSDWATWRDVSRGLPGFGLLAIAVDPVSPATLYVYTTSGLFRSDDAGASWSREGLAPFGGFRGDTLVIGAQPGSPMYATSAGRLFRSDDRGVSWQPLNLQQPPGARQTLVADPLQPSVLYGPYSRSVDGGLSWQLLPTLPAQIYAVAAPAQLPEVRFAGTSDGIYRSDDSGATWQRDGQALAGVPVYALSASAGAQIWIDAGTRGRGVARKLLFAPGAERMLYLPAVAR